MGRILTFLKRQLTRVRAGRAGLAPAADGPAVPDPADEAVALAVAPPDEPGEAHRDAPRPRRPLVLGLAALMLLAAGAGVATLMVRGWHAQALAAAQARTTALEEENRRLRAQAVSLVPAVPAPAQAARPEQGSGARATPAMAAVALPREPPLPNEPTPPGEPAVTPDRGAPRHPPAGECLVSGTRDTAAQLRPCIERFNRLSRSNP